MIHLFKLKKDGKTVGYLKIDRCLPNNPNRKELIVFSSSVDEATHWFENEPQFEYDEVCPFVTKDKNGKEVFDGDKVDSMGNRCLVMWHKVHRQWCLWHIEGDYYFGALTSKESIELIEDSNGKEA